MASDAVRANSVQEPDRSEKTARYGFRFCVRLDGSIAQWLRKRCGETAKTPSSVLRSALRAARAAADAADVAPSGDGELQPAAASAGPLLPYEFPKELESLRIQLRCFGASVRTERRRRFGALLALSELALQASQDRRDLELCAELLALGKRFGLL